ncbi:MAG: hypothetical protein ACRD2B_17640 [Terriglobia bacterium]
MAEKAQNLFYPLPNFGPPSLQVGNWQGLYPIFTDQDSVDGRVDYKISERNRFYARYTYHRTPEPYSRDNLPPLGIINELRTGDSGVLSWTHTFSPTVLNEFRMGFARNWENEAPEVNGYQDLQQLGIQGVPTGPGYDNAPAFNITCITSTDVGSETYNIGNDFQYTDDLTWVWGSHSMKFGTNIVRDQINSYGNSDLYGVYNFTGVYSGFAYALRAGVMTCWAGGAPRTFSP